MLSATPQRFHPPHQPAAGSLKVSPISKDGFGESPQLVLTARSLSIDNQKWALKSWGVVVVDGI